MEIFDIRNNYSVIIVALARQNLLHSDIGPLSNSVKCESFGQHQRMTCHSQPDRINKRKNYNGNCLQHFVNQPSKHRNVPPHTLQVAITTQRLW